MGSSRNIWEHLGTSETIWVSYRTVKNTQTNLMGYSIYLSIHIRTLGHLDLCSQSSANNQCCPTLRETTHFILCFWWPWHSSTRVWERCLLRPFDRFSRAPWHQQLVRHSQSGEMVHLLTATTRQSGQSSLLRLIFSGAQLGRLMNGRLLLHNAPC